MQTWYANTAINCRSGANSGTTIELSWGRCTPINVYRTPMRVDSINNWFNSKTYECYLDGRYLSSSQPDSCKTTTTTGVCTCVTKGGTKDAFVCNDYDLNSHSDCNKFCITQGSSLLSSACKKVSWL